MQVEIAGVGRHRQREVGVLQSGVVTEWRIDDPVGDALTRSE